MTDRVDPRVRRHQEGFFHMHTTMCDWVLRQFPAKWRKVFEHFILACCLALTLLLVAMHVTHIGTLTFDPGPTPAGPPVLSAKSSNRFCLIDFLDERQALFNTDMIELVIEAPPRTTPPSALDTAIGRLVSLSWRYDDSSAAKTLTLAKFRYTRRPSMAVLLLNRTELEYHRFTSRQIQISVNHKCFGNSLLRWFTRYMQGFDTVMINQFTKAFGPNGFLYSVETGGHFNLHLGKLIGTPPLSPPKYAFDDSVPDSFGKRNTSFFVVRWILYKLFVVVGGSALLYASLTTMCNFMLHAVHFRTTQFTTALQERMAQGRSYYPMIFSQLVGSATIVPAFMVVFFILNEFYQSAFIGLQVMLEVTAAEFFTIVFARTGESQLFLPRVFALYLCIFHVYFFSFSAGFDTMALACLMLFVLHAFCMCINNFELQALESGFISRQNPRAFVPAELRSVSSLCRNLFNNRVTRTFFDWGPNFLFQQHAHSTNNRQGASEIATRWPQRRALSLGDANSARGRLPFRRRLSDQFSSITRPRSFSESQSLGHEDSPRRRHRNRIW